MEGCVGPVAARGWCQTHYHQMHAMPVIEGRGPCVYPGCGKPIRYLNLGLCAGHYAQKLRSTTEQPLREMTDPRIRDDQGRKRCRRCGEWLPERRFMVNNDRLDRLNGYCRTCDRGKSLYRNFGITLTQFDAMVEAQGGGCAICGHPGSEENRLSVDHDHACCPGKKGKKTCGKCVRAILCARCNTGLGQFYDNPDTLMAAAFYLRRHGVEVTA